MVGSTWLQGAFVYAVQDARDGVFDASLGEVFVPRLASIVPLLVAGLLAGLGIAVGLLLLIVPGLFLLTIWAVIAPVIVVEKRAALESFGRSRELVRGHGWTVFGIVLITGLLSGIASSLLQAAFSFLPRFLEILVGSTIAQAVVAPFGAIALAITYFRLRDAQRRAAREPAAERVTLDPETEERIEEPASAEAVREARLTPAEAVEHMRIRVPERGNRKLRRVLERANADRQLKGWWHVSNVNAVVRLEINDHSWVHIQIVANIALKLLRQLDEARRRAVASSATTGCENEDAEVVVVLAALTALRRDVGAPAGPRGLEPLPRRAEAPRAARRDLRGAGPHGDRVGGAAGDHEPPRRRRAALARGRDPPRRPTRSTWRRAARGSRSRRARSRCTRSRPPRSRRS